MCCKLDCNHTASNITYFAFNRLTVRHTGSKSFPDFLLTHCVHVLVFAVARSTCSLPRAAGSCSEWTLRFYYNILTSQCTHFWYGSCHGNSNNFLSHEECQRACPVPAPVPDPPSGSGPAFTTPTIGGSGMGGSSSVGSMGAGSRSMGRIFTVHGSSASGAGRQATSAATHAQRGRLHMRHRRPSHTAAAQHSRPAAR